MKNFLITLMIIGAGLAIFLKAKHTDKKDKPTMSRENPIKAEAIAKMGDKYPELYVQRFIDVEYKTICYIFNRSISCVQQP